MSGIDKQEQAGWKCRKLFSERKVSSYSVRRRALPVVDMVCVLTELRVQKWTEEMVVGVERLKKQEIQVHLGIDVTHSGGLGGKKIGVERKIDICIEQEALSRR